MPELPEVETTVRDLQKKVLGRTFVDVWTDFPKVIKKPANFSQFKKEIKGKRIQRIWRRGKNILFDLSENKTLLIHQKLTGHLLFGRWEKVGDIWQGSIGPLSEKINSYIHLLFTFDTGEMLALSDLRKFAKTELWKSLELEESEGFKNLGPEPLEKNFTFEKFKEVLKEKRAAKGEPRQRRGKIKQVLMDQTIIAGIGNIYSDEILWEAKIHPLRRVNHLRNSELKMIYQNIKDVLLRAIQHKGSTIRSNVEEFRRPEGLQGEYQEQLNAYYQKGEKKCSRCGGTIQKAKIGSRNAHYCPQCQKL